ncbi:hypothetical protein BCR34DRAFT_559620 [Clohesyomyces aquaticus]|uniref:Uncharacterized protein n=1 Tax=Clohesyomyces aquaticus TaxID=1231657 RepID=A0A1Y1ZXG0_9PLEO|nr:hypothetical protein BCR34DRAFT_559620 [Clohesyomyces aquaticus]
MVRSGILKCELLQNLSTVYPTIYLVLCCYSIVFFFNACLSFLVLFMHFAFLVKYHVISLSYVGLSFAFFSCTPVLFFYAAVQYLCMKCIWIFLSLISTRISGAFPQHYIDFHWSSYPQFAVYVANRA